MDGRIRAGRDQGMVLSGFGRHVMQPLSLDIGADPWIHQ
jgi:hypothetical protein